jgi:hypothetical protein
MQQIADRLEEICQKYIPAFKRKADAAEKTIWEFRKKHAVAFFIILTLLGSAITFARRIDAVSYPQFWAEDGVFWYSEAYNTEHWYSPLLEPKQKYYQSVSRLGAMVAMPFDIGYTPLIFNTLAVLITVLTGVYLLSSRFDTLIPKLSHRVILFLVYLCIPGVAEVHANLTNAQWHLALLMILVIVASPPKKVSEFIFDAIVLIIAGLSGPFVFFGVITFFLYLVFKRSKEKLALFGILLLTFLIQIHSYLFIVVPGAERSSAPLGANSILFLEILSRNVFLNGIVGTDISRSISKLPLYEAGVLPVIIGVSGLLLLSYFLYHASLEGRLFVGFAFMILLAGMLSPQVSLTKAQWPIMANGSGGRYYFLPILGWMFTLLFLTLKAPSRYVQRFCFVLSFIFIIYAVPTNFILKPLKNFHFKEQVAEFHNLSSGESYTFQFPPSWKVTLVKK